jgi:hypothetical protein
MSGFGWEPRGLGEANRALALARRGARAPVRANGRMRGEAQPDRAKRGPWPIRDDVEQARFGRIAHAIP